MLCRHLPKLQRLLESDDVNMRIAAGETIALLFELARDIDSVSLQLLFNFPQHQIILKLISCVNLNANCVSFLTCPVCAF